MCVAAEGVINLTQEQPAAEKHCTQPTCSYYANMTTTVTNANICMSFKAIIDGFF